MDRKRKVSLVAGCAAVLTATVYWLANSWSGSMTFPDGTTGDFSAPLWLQAGSSAFVGIVAACAALALSLAFIRKTPNHDIA